MRRSDMASYAKPVRPIHHNNMVYHLYDPDWDTYTAVQVQLTRIGKLKPDSPESIPLTSGMMILAIKGTLRFEGDDEPPTDQEAQVILQNTSDQGFHSSPVARAALEMCGIVFPDEADAEEEADLPSGSLD